MTLDFCKFKRTGYVKMHKINSVDILKMFTLQEYELFQVEEGKSVKQAKRM